MWSWFNCYLSGRHDFGMWCEPGTVFLRCVNCGKRSSGWALSPAHHPAAALAPAQTVKTVKTATIPAVGRVVPFQRVTVP